MSDEGLRDLLERALNPVPGRCHMDEESLVALCRALERGGYGSGERVPVDEGVVTIPEWYEYGHARTDFLRSYLWLTERVEGLRSRMQQMMQEMSTDQSISEEARSFCVRGRARSRLWQGQADQVPFAYEVWLEEPNRGRIGGLGGGLRGGVIGGLCDPTSVTDEEIRGRILGFVRLYLER